MEPKRSAPLVAAPAGVEKQIRGALQVVVCPSECADDGVSLEAHGHQLIDVLRRRCYWRLRLLWLLRPRQAMLRLRPRRDRRLLRQRPALRAGRGAAATCRRHSEAAHRGPRAVGPATSDLRRARGQQTPEAGLADADDRGRDAQPTHACHVHAVQKTRDDAAESCSGSARWPDRNQLRIAQRSCVSDAASAACGTDADAPAGPGGTCQACCRWRLVRFAPARPAAHPCSRARSRQTAGRSCTGSIVRAAACGRA